MLSQLLSEPDQGGMGFYLTFVDDHAMSWDGLGFYRTELINAEEREEGRCTQDRQEILVSAMWASGDAVK
jgi:hypothetical protein